MNDFTKYTDSNEKSETKHSSIKSKEIVVVVIVIIVIVLLGFAYKLFISSSANTNLKPYKALGSGSAPYQAIFLNNTNASVYFGKIEGTSSHWLYLNDVFYIKLNGSSTSAKAPTASHYSLVHLGPTLSYGPTDHMKINLSQVLFIEDLSLKSSVYKAIGSYYKSHPKK